MTEPLTEVQQSIRDTLAGQIAGARSAADPPIGLRKAEAASGIHRTTITWLESGRAVLTIGRAEALATTYGLSLPQALPVLQRTPGADEVAAARDALSEIPIEHVMLLAHAAGHPASWIIGKR